MKKVFFPVLMAAALVMASCGNKTSKNAEGTDTAAAVAVEDGDEAQAVADELQNALNGKDSETISSTLEKVSAQYKALVEEGKLEEAKAYASKVQQFINEHADEITAATSGNATVTSIINTVKNLPTSAEATAEEAAAAVKSDVKNAAEGAVETAKEAANEKVNEVKAQTVDKANEAVSNAKEKANKKVEEANKKATDAINSAASKLKLK